MRLRRNRSGWLVSPLSSWLHAPAEAPPTPPSTRGKAKEAATVRRVAEGRADFLELRLRSQLGQRDELRIRIQQQREQQRRRLGRCVERRRRQRRWFGGRLGTGRRRLRHRDQLGIVGRRQRKLRFERRFEQRIEQRVDEQLQQRIVGTPGRRELRHSAARRRPYFGERRDHGPYSTMVYAATSAVRSTMAYDTTSAHIYYPVGATAPFASIAIVPGWVSAESTIARLGSVPRVVGHRDDDHRNVQSLHRRARHDRRSERARRRAARCARHAPGRERALGQPPQRRARRQPPSGRRLVQGRRRHAHRREHDADAQSSLRDGAVERQPLGAGRHVPQRQRAHAHLRRNGASPLAGPPMPATQYGSIPTTTPKMLTEYVQQKSLGVDSPPTRRPRRRPDPQSTANVAALRRST